MFEKEANEYESKYWDSLVDSDDIEMLGEAFKDGAEFGYNKAEKELVKAEEKISYLEDNLRVARKDRENLQLNVAKGLKEFVKDFPATTLRYLANEKYVERHAKAKEIIRDLLSCLYSVEYDRVSDLEQAEQFLTEE